MHIFQIVAYRSSALSVVMVWSHAPDKSPITILKGKGSVALLISLATVLAENDEHRIDVDRVEA